MSASVVEVDAPAKVNLLLRVLARESSGYHSLESLFCAIGLMDRVRIERAAEGVALTVGGGVETGPEHQNLAGRAARWFLRQVGGGGVRIALHKRIPAAAGLGGGSSDAAATLRGMNRLFGDPLSEEALLQGAIEMGSDIPFFLGGSPLALGWSRGERLLALPPLPAVPVLVVHPGEAMPTGLAFERLSAMRGGEYRPRAGRLRLVDLSSWEGVMGVAENDFDPVVRAGVPRAGRAVEALRAGGAWVAMVAGSGASVFGVFPAGDDTGEAEARLGADGFAVWRCRTLEAMPEVRTEG